MAKERFTWDGWIEVFAIFKRYGADAEIAVEHDVIYAGPHPATVTEEDKDRLDALGWYGSEKFDCFYRFV